MGDRVFDDDRPTVDLGPRPSDDEAPEALGADDVDAPSATLTSAPHPPTPAATARSAAGADALHHQPTQQLPPRRRSSTGSMSRISDSKTTSSPVEAMRLDEIERTRVFSKLALSMCVGGVIVALLTSGDMIAQWVVIVGSTIAALGALWILRVLATDKDYEQGKVVVPALMIAGGAMSGVYYWGSASPVSAMVVYGIYFFSLGASKRVTLGMYLTVAVLHGLLGLGIITGVIADRGVISMQALRPLDQVAIVAIVECLYFVAFITARVSQKVTLDAMNKLEQATRGVAQREALLAEARAELDRALKIGGPGRFTEQIVGSFRLGVLIGRGGMGEVYEAHGVTDKREAAVKLLHPGTLADPTSVARFMREAQTAAKLDCPYVVRVLEVGTTGGEIPFLAMERLRGHDLAHQLRRHRRLQLQAANAVVGPVSVGLEAARAAGIVHRDLKPHNLFAAEEGGSRTWKILDFGVSKSGGSGTLTQGHVIGTPAYMAPEQARGEDVDHRADVYSLAAILFRAVTGHPAFTGKDVPTTLYDVVYRIPTQPTLLAELPADIDRVLALGLAKEPKDRFSTALELAEWFALAIDSNLTPAQRQRADELIERQPWGTRPGTTRA
ncbi:MAG: serine/threonine-protein kinase [Kofleriaceae bacterium]|nr:serine/threonine-protein kinase [Kofleriaceae bacterium]